jgi:hypothetical protein
MNDTQNARYWIRGRRCHRPRLREDWVSGADGVYHLLLQEYYGHGFGRRWWNLYLNQQAGSPCTILGCMTRKKEDYTPALQPLSLF